MKNIIFVTDVQLKAHFTLYEGYVKKLNEIEEKLKTADKSAANYSFNEWSEWNIVNERFHRCA